MTSFSWPVRVYYEDTDAGGIVYYANYLKFCERARTEWLRHLGIEQDGFLAAGIGFVVRQVQLDMRAPARYNDLLTVTATPHKVGRASLSFAQEIYNQDDKLLCRAGVKVACVELERMKPVAIPDPIAEVINRGS